MVTLDTSIQHYTTIPSSTNEISQENIKDFQIAKEVKLSSFADNMIVNVESMM